MQQPVDFYYHPTPNPSKVALFLEESGIAYRLVPVDIAKGNQHSAEFRALNPNGKVPVVVENGIAIFDSSAILLHLAGKAGAFLGEQSDQGQAELLSWLMFIASGVGPSRVKRSTSRTTHLLARRTGCIAIALRLSATGP